MTVEELKLYDGRNNAKAYIAYKNVVYDVTESPLWQGGEHQGMHSAGVDLTSALSGAPHGDEVFKDFPVVGSLETDETAKPVDIDPPQDRKTHLRILYKKYHPHPMTVHFPIALHLFAAAFDIFFLTDKKEIYAVLVFYSFFVATVMGFVAMIPGVLSWWINYNLSTQRAFMVKIIVATLTLLLGVVAIGIYLEDPNIVFDTTLKAFVYHTIVLLTGFNVIVLGYYGGKISWGKLEEEKKQRVSLDKTEYTPASSVPTSSVRKLPEEKTTVGNEDRASISILIGGAAGLGIETLEKILSGAFKTSGYYVYSTKEFMSRVRGGSNTTLLRIGNFPIQAPCWEVDIAVALDALALEHMQERYTKSTLIFADDSFNEKGFDIIAVAMKER